MKPWKYKNLFIKTDCPKSTYRVNVKFIFLGEKKRGKKRKDDEEDFIDEEGLDGNELGNSWNISV